MTVERNSFLDTVGKHLNRNRPNTPEGLNYTAHIETSPDRSFYNINLRSRGCSHNLRGGCTVCDYWVSRDLDPSRMVDFTREALGALDCTPDMLEVGPYGSMLDDQEVPPKVRREIYRLMKSIGAPFYAVFTRFDTITEDKLAELVEYFEPTEVSVDMGLEISDPWKLKYCVNKALGIGQITSAIELLKRFHLYSAAYILLGVPFLTSAEMIEDTVSSVLWALSNGIDYAVVFPVHVKPWTVVRWLYEHDLYEPISLWSLVEVLARIPPKLLTQVGISWHNERAERSHPLYEIPKITPETCPLCQDQVVSILESYRFSADRVETVTRLAEIECECRDAWRRRLNAIVNMPLEERVKDIYRKMGVDILGEDWWADNGEGVLASVSVHESES